MKHHAPLSQQVPSPTVNHYQRLSLHVNSLPPLWSKLDHDHQQQLAHGLAQLILRLHRIQNHTHREEDIHEYR